MPRQRKIAPSGVPSATSTKIRMNHRRASLDEFSLEEIQSQNYRANLLKEAWAMRFLWTCAGISISNLGESPKISLKLKVARVLMVVCSLGYWIMVAACFFSAGHFHSACFMLCIGFLVSLPSQMLCWYYHDHHSLHLLLMISVLKTHAGKIFKRINYGYGAVIAAAGGALVYIPTVYSFYDLDLMKVEKMLFGVDNLQVRIFWWIAGYISLFSWVPSGFSLVLSCCSIMAGHYVECETHRSRCLTSYRTYITSNSALYDLQVIFLRIVQTSSSWSKCVLWALTSSSMCFFYMLVTYLADEGFMLSVFPPLGIMLPALWSTAFAAGAVTSRFVRIYIAINTRSPLLLLRSGDETGGGEEDGKQDRRHRDTDKFLKNAGVSLSITTGIVKDKKDDISDDSEDLDDDLEAAVSSSKNPKVKFDVDPSSNWTSTPEFTAYKSSHLLLMELCKHFEDIFGVRIFGLKITAAQLLQIATFYGTGATLILQNSGKVSMA
ncbi:hypothetical protein TrST_g8439 [Triparma strigata]|uniref:Uncharacterized protein n=1 Tax=Triparma strigata TaxID=1606541 RepID=A0A9W7E7L8_9STRA|nr:hypothetical protein TrST_g8439 [Triparma strigata]